MPVAVLMSYRRQGVMERQRAIHFIHTLRRALSQRGALDRLRARRAEPWARDLLLIAYRLGLMDHSP
jgi:hypothetical protein